MHAWGIDKRGTTADIKRFEIDRPTVGPQQVLVRVHAAALNSADLKVLSGKDGGRFLHSGKAPILLGFDFSGVVEEVGSSASSWAVGDEVFGFLPYSSKTTQGSFSEYVSVDADSVGRKPQAASHAEAASVATVASTALQGLQDKGALQAGQRVLIHGASGGVGSFAVQIAKNIGAEVWGTGGASSQGYLKEIGVDHPVDYRQTAPQDLDQSFHVILDAACVSSYGALAARIVDGGTYVTLLPSLGLLTGILRCLFSSKSCHFVAVTAQGEVLGQLGEWLDEGRLSAPLEATFPVEELPRALDRLAAGGVKGKIAIVLAE